MKYRRLALILLATCALVVAAACSEEDRDNARDTVDDVTEDVENAGDNATVRASAEAFRAALISDDRDIRNPEAIQDAAEDLPGDPEVSGLDGLDDVDDLLDADLDVEFKVGDAYACVSIPADGEDGDIDIENERC